MPVGIDMTTISRFEEHQKFANKILSTREYQEYSKSSDKKQFVASRFCLKEAFAKSLKIGVLDIDLKLIEIIKEESGAIHIEFNGKSYECSLSHERDTCVGVVVYD